MAADRLRNDNKGHQDRDSWKRPNQLVDDQVHNDLQQWWTVSALQKWGGEFIVIVPLIEINQ